MKYKFILFFSLVTSKPSSGLKRVGEAWLSASHARAIAPLSPFSSLEKVAGLVLLFLGV